MTIDAPPTAAVSREEKRQRRRIPIVVIVLVAFVIAYGLSLLGVHLLQKSEGSLPPLDLSQAGPDETVVQISLEELKATTNRLTVNVLIYPGESLYDKRFDELNTDIAVRLYPPNDLGDLTYPKGKAPAQVTTTIKAHGDPGTWPFDSYRTEPLSADVFVGTGAERKRIPALVEVTWVDGRLGRHRQTQHRLQRNREPQHQQVVVTLIGTRGRRSSTWASSWS